MGPDDTESRLGGRPAPDLERREAAAGARDLAAIPGREAPGIPLVDAHDARLFEQSCRRRDGVIGRGRAIDETDQVRYRVLHDAGA